MPVVPCGVIVLVLAVWLITARHRIPAPTPYLLLLLLLFFALGGIHATLSLHPPAEPTDIHNLAQGQREASLVGVLVRAPEIGPGRTTLLMKVEEIMDGSERRRAGGLIQLAMAEPPPPDLVPGDLFVTRASIGPVVSFGIPGAFNYQEYLAYQGIRTSGWVRSGALIMKINRLPSPSLPESLRFLPERIRYQLSRFLASSLPSPTAGVYQAILLGERANLSPKVQESFTASGSVHLLSISGLHMALVSLCVTMVLSWLLKRSEWVLLHLPASKVAALLSLLPLTAYAMIAGFAPPVVRSLIMVAVFVVALVVDRQWSIGNNIAIAALLLLAMNPAFLFTASFQLTFAAVAAIALFAPTVACLLDPGGESPANEPRLLPKVWLGLKRWGTASLLVSIAATLGTVPILAHQFNQISLVSPISTLLIEPFLCLWSLLLGLAACLTIGIPALAYTLLSLGTPGITAAVAIADLCASLPFSSIRVPTPGVAAIVGWYGLLLLAASWKKLTRRQLVLGIMVGIGLMATDLLPAETTRHATTLTILDVGQGSAMVIEMPNHEAILIDGGRMQSTTRTGFDVGEDLIAPFLWHKKIRRLSAVVCSHPDSDHYNGIPFILRQFKPRTLWVNGYQSEEKGYMEMLSLAAELGIETKVPGPRTVLFQGEDAALTVLAGGQRAKATPAPLSSTNNQSLVLRLTRGRNTFLLPSDIEVEAEQTLLKQDGLKTDVLVAPHHGSATSSSEGFVAATAPRYVAISAGRNQSGHFPAPETVSRYRKVGSTILTTAEHGSLIFHSNGQEIRVETYR